MANVKFCPSEAHIQVKKGLLRKSSTQESYPMERLYVQEVMDGSLSYKPVGWICPKCGHVEIE
ncbi:MAG: hypothetical protein RE471_00940 [Ferroplasma sp.]|uniref:hypothetical protein n=1 Tax=Ferroplasma sp. TaxID=2591003 RepID=UPI0028155EC3|nr:hypothetical protein [Ferroplasma sp.]WMT51462.1 MAG: hypothetical protein RE471_00940 [Ferroplasma sp.]